MRCPYCNHNDTLVRDTRATEDGAVVRRRRACERCGARVTTFERAQLRELTVQKSDGRAQPFDRNKILLSAKIAIRKRPVTEADVEQMVSGIVRQLESSGNDVVSSRNIGDLVMMALRDIDTVAFVRFASVYRDFTRPDDFADLVDDLAQAAEAAVNSVQQSDTSAAQDASEPSQHSENR